MDQNGYSGLFSGAKVGRSKKKDQKAGDGVVPTAVAYLRGVKRSRVNEKKKGMKSIQEVEANRYTHFLVIFSCRCIV